MGDTDVRRNLARQREYYGEPLGDRVRRLVRHYDVSQAQLAEVMGISPPMLSQVMSGRRQKIATPSVLAKMVLLERGITRRETASGPPQARLSILAEVRSTSPAAALAAAAAPDSAAVVQGLRAELSSAELAAAAAHVAEASPRLADLLARASRPGPGGC